MVDGSNNVFVELGSRRPVNQPETKKDQCSPPCVADVFHKPYSQLGRSCPNHRQWEKEEEGGLGKEEGGSGGQWGGWRIWQRSDRLRRPGVWELSGKACAKCSETKYHLTSRLPWGFGVQCACMCKRVRAHGFMDFCVSVPYI